METVNDKRCQATVTVCHAAVPSKQLIDDLKDFWRQTFSVIGLEPNGVLGVAWVCLLENLDQYCCYLVIELNIMNELRLTDV